MEERARTLVSVSFVNDNDVEKIRNGSHGKKVTTIPLSQRGRGKLTNSSQNSAGDCAELQPLQETEEEVSDIFFKPTELLDDGKDYLRGSSVFGFCTPKKKWGMLEKAESVKKISDSPTTPKTPKSSLKKYPRTPQTPRTPDSTSRSGFRTPRSKRSLSEVMQKVKTPYNFRKRVKQRIKKIVCEEDSSSSEEESDDDSYHNSSASDDESKENFELEENLVWTPVKTPKRTPLKLGKTPSSTPGRTPSRKPGKGGKGRKVKDVEMIARSDDYFMSHGEPGKVVTSDHTLSRLETPRLSPEALQAVLSEVFVSHQKERETLVEEHLQMFPRWMTFLCEGFSIFLYGLGSKKQLISKFQEQYLSGFSHIVVNGFFPSLTLRNILNNITEDILEYTGSFHGVHEQLEFIQDFYSRPDTDSLFVIIHNLDGPMLRGEKTQAAIAHLASLTNVHLLASIDHINAPLVFDGSKMSLYNALWWDATTLAAYSEETSYENSLLVQQSGSLALSSLINVFKVTLSQLPEHWPTARNFLSKVKPGLEDRRSLTPNAKGIFLLLAQNQLDHKDNSNFAGLSFNDLYQRCRESFLVNSDLTLRAQLTEFRDHKLIRSKKGADGVENLHIPLDATTLHDFIGQQEL